MDGDEAPPDQKAEDADSPATTESTTLHSATADSSARAAATEPPEKDFWAESSLGHKIKSFLC